MGKDSNPGGGFSPFDDGGLIDDLYDFEAQTPEEVADQVKGWVLEDVEDVERVAGAYMELGHNRVLLALFRALQEETKNESSDWYTKGMAASFMYTHGVSNLGDTFFPPVVSGSTLVDVGEELQVYKKQQLKVAEFTTGNEADAVRESHALELFNATDVPLRNMLMDIINDPKLDSLPTQSQASFVEGGIVTGMYFRRQMVRDASKDHARQK